MVFPAIKQLLGVATGRSVSAGLNLLFSLALIRLLTKEEYGTFFIYYTVMTFATSIPGLAINSAFVYHYQHSDNRNGLLSTFLLGKAAFTLLSVAVAVTLYAIGSIDDITAIAVTSGLFLSFFDSAICLSQAQQRFKYFAGLMPIRNIVIIMMLCLVFSLTDSFGLREVMWALLIASVVLAAISISLSSAAKIHHFSQNSLIELLRSAKRFIVFESSAVILQRIEVWILGYFAVNGSLSAADIAEYGASLTFAFFFPIISSSVTSILITKVKSGERLGSSGLHTLMHNAIIAFLIAVVYSLFTYHATKFVVPDKYQELHWLIPAICLGMFFSFCTNYARIRLLAHEGDHFVDIVYFLQVIVGATSSILLIDQFGLQGAVMAFLIVRIFALVLIGWKFLKENLKNVR